MSRPVSRHVVVGFFRIHCLACVVCPNNESAVFFKMYRPRSCFYFAVTDFMPFSLRKRYCNMVLCGRPLNEEAAALGADCHGMIAMHPLEFLAFTCGCI